MKKRFFAAVLFAAALSAALIGAASVLDGKVQPGSNSAPGWMGPGPTEQVENLQAFAKLYGLVRYFHPSDAAAQVDWNKVAVFGAREARSATGQADLRRRLEQIFLPIAPTVRLFPEGQRPPPPSAVLSPEDTSGLTSVAWQHKGNGVRTALPRLYTSRRTGRLGPAVSWRETGPQNAPLAEAKWQTFKAERFWGREVRFRASIRPSPETEVWIGVGTIGRKTWKKKTGLQGWADVQVKRRVPRGAKSLQVRVALGKEGQARVRPLALEIQSEESRWKQVEVSIPGTEGQNAGLGRWHFPDGIGTPASAEGRGRILLRKASPSEVRLFEKAPRPGETTTVDIGRGLKAQVPLGLWSNGGQTLRPEGAPPADSLAARLRRFSAEEGGAARRSGTARRLGAALQAWNAVYHFYPYAETVGVEWTPLLRKALRKALHGRSWKEVAAALREMLVGLKDGHAWVEGAGGQRFRQWPVRFDWADRKVVVAKTAGWGWESKGPCAKPGDVLLGISGKPTRSLLRRAKGKASGSLQRRRQEALSRLWPTADEGTADEGPVRLQLQRDERTVLCRLRSRAGRGRGEGLEGPPEPRPASISVLSDSIGYVDLTRVEWGKVTAAMDSLSEKSGLILDVRGYPRGQNGLIASHLWEGGRPLRGIGTRTPEIAYPRRHFRRQRQADTSGSGGDFGNWIRPREPTFEGPVVALTGPEAISKAESVVGVLKYSDLATIVGRRTAGITGAINRTPLVGPLVITWTGRQARGPDGGRFHGIGVRPDIRAGRTPEGIREGTDEVLQRGLKTVRKELKAGRDLSEDVSEAEGASESKSSGNLR